MAHRCPDCDKTWRCFHCDELFTDPRLAWEHFGDDTICACDVPGCVDPLRTDEKARLKELREAVEHALKMQRESEEADEKVSLLEIFQSEIGRYFGDVGGVKASTPHQAWLKFEAAENLVKAHEERVARLERCLDQALKQTGCNGDLCLYEWHEQARSLLSEPMEDLNER